MNPPQPSVPLLDSPQTEDIGVRLSRARPSRTRLQRLIWGERIAPHSHMLTRWWFLRGLGAIYLVAIASFGVQMMGLIGSRGITPVADFLNAIASAYPAAERYRLVPTLLWLNSSDGALQALVIVGIVCAVLLIFDVAPMPMLVALWAIYFSIVHAGQVFMSFQWDILLLEAGFLAIFLAPLSLLPRSPFRNRERQREPSMIVVWLFRLLLFRLMFLSGAVKLLSGDPTWHNLTAMNYHYWTQPLPTPLAWWMAQLPPEVHRLETLFTFVAELAVPFLFFAPRRLRFTGGLVTILLQALIILTGNYTFFNLLTIVLCLLLFDDDALLALVRRRPAPVGKSPSRIRQVVSGVLALVIGLSGILIVVSTVTQRSYTNLLPAPLRDLVETTRDYNLVNGYGLFAVMTTTRPEIILEGSDDGDTWLAYEFPYKAGDVTRSPVYVAPHQPRLDWQMWFAALGDYRSNRWFISLVERLLEGEPSVLALLAYNPFSDAPPRFIRARLYQYHFTDAATRSATGAWWTRDDAGLYLPAVSLENFTRP